MNIETGTLVAIIGILCSSTFAAIGLTFNFLATRRSNRIAVSTKLAELSKLLSDELMERVEMLKLLEKELKETAEYAVRSIAAPKITSLKEQIEANLKRQDEIDGETEYLEKAFLDLDKVDVGGVDAHYARLYRSQRSAAASLAFAEKLKRERIA